MSSKKKARHSEGCLGHTISFRLDDAMYRLLEAHAAQAQLSPPLLAREFVLSALQERSPWHLVIGSIRLLRGDVATATEALLANAGKISPKDASEWVDENFREHALDLTTD